MLQFIHVQNYVIARSIEIAFGPGLSVLTGETGAGKSILLDALGLVLGDRADAAAVRQGADAADITASFDLAQLSETRQWLTEHDLNDDDQCYLRRVIGNDGRSRAYINGRPVPVTLLRELGSRLVDIHGQHEHQSLMNRATQLQIIDRFGGLDGHAQQVGQHYSRWRELRRQRDELSGAEAQSGARRELLRFQLDELTSLALHEGEYEQLCQRQEVLAHRDETVLACQKSAQMLAGEEPGNLSDLLRDVLQTLAGPARRVAELTPSYDDLQSALIQLEEAARTIRHVSEQLDNDPNELATLEERLRVVHDLARKHRCAASALCERQSELAAEFAALDQLESTLERLNADLAQAEIAYRNTSARLTAARTEVCHALSQKITAQMQGLGMTGGRFDIVLNTDAERFSMTGSDQIEFQVAANPGQPLRPLAKVASGGELSRISLALQVAVAGATTIPTLIFDEVDSGIGGPVAEVVGQQLSELGREVQVLCVTHLAQVASQAQHHYCVKKATQGSETLTTIVALDAQARVAETARMTGGLEITEATLKHAREMIERGAERAAAHLPVQRDQLGN